MEANNWSLPHWFDLVRSGNIVLPRFQRHEAWSHSQVEGLINTVLRGLPCGALLTLEKGDQKSFICRPCATAPQSSDSFSHYLLDGQQRLTALWRALNATYEDRAYFIRPGDGKTEPDTVESVRLTYREGRRHPLYVDDPVETWCAGEGFLPLELLCPGHDGEQRVGEWRAAASGGDPAEALRIADHLTRLRGAVATFNMPVLTLPRSTAPDTALDVFVQMNTSASPLSTYDIMVAQIEAHTGESLHDLVDDLKARVPALAAYYDPAKLVLYVTSLMLDQPSSRARQKGEKFARAVVAHFEAIVDGSRRAVDFLEDERVFDEQRLPSDVVVPALAYLWTTVPDGGDAEGRARTLMRRYLWRAFCTHRYESATAQKVHADVRALSAQIRGEKADPPPIFDEQAHPLPDAEQIASAGWPRKRDRLARSVLAVALRSGAHDFADGRPVSRGSLQTREYHHLFPKDWLARRDVLPRQIDLALNCALLTWRTNRTIAAKSPATYLAERLDGASGDATELRERLASHEIPFAPIEAENYDEFLERRADRIRDVMVALCAPVNAVRRIDRAA